MYSGGGEAKLYSVDGVYSGVCVAKLYSVDGMYLEAKLYSVDDGVYLETGGAEVYPDEWVYPREL